MNRVFLYLTSAAALPLLADASLKGAALLVLAGAVVLLMRRSSAAARHMVWLAAVVALLLVPVLAVVLPGWRVLPQWAVVEAHAAPPAAEHRPHEAYRPFEPYTPAPHAAPDTLPSPASIAPLEPLPPTVASVPAPLPPAAAPPVAAPAPPATSWLLPLWAAGCSLLLLRLAAAHFLLRRNTRRCEPASGPLAAAFAAAQQESSLRQPVRLLMDNARSIPVVWGVFRPTLLLPAEAVTWDAAQLRSVLLHELAHLRRRDPLVQFLTQIACALHWFNPLVWLAAWRLHVERERACDDMVLASGVRPSTYAEHLLHIATQLSPARWTQACGLAMARKSSLEGRLTAVLSDKLNRRRLTRALTAAAILLSAAIAVPIAMLRAQEEKPATSSAETDDVKKPGPASKQDKSSKLPADSTVVVKKAVTQESYISAAKVVQIQKSRLEWNLEGNARLRTKSLAVDADEIYVAFKPDSGGGHEVESVRAFGQVRMLWQDKFNKTSAAQGGKIAYDDSKGLISIEDHPIIQSGDRLLVGSGIDSTAAISLKGEEARLTKFSVGSITTTPVTTIPEVSDGPIPEIGQVNVIPPATEAQLDWGEPVNGLRGAIVIRPTVPGAEPGVFLAVQNVSDKPLRFADTIAAEGLRKMIVSDTKGILFALTSKEPSQTDVQLKPRAVVYLRLLEPTASAQKDVEPTMIEGLRKDPLQTWRAVLDIQNAPDGAWKGKLTTGETRGAISLHGPQPKDPKAQALYKLWQNNARLNGDIPGGLVSLLHDKVKEFIRNNEPDASGAPYAAKMKPLEPRFGEVRDWKPADVVALLDDIAAASTIPLETTLEQLSQQTLQPGQPLPPAYEKADWGEPYEPLDCGLRAAFLLEPFEGTYRLGTEVKARILLHNSGEKAVVFTTTSFQQPEHTATLPEGQKLNIETTFWTTLGRSVAYRLAPGEYCELSTPGIGIGAQNKDREDWANVRAGAWIHCKADDCVLLYPGQVSVSANGEKGEAAHRWWQEFIAARLDREAPVPSGQREREYLLYRVVRELFGSAPSVEEGNSFAADTSPDALRNLAAILSRRNHVFPTADAVVPGLSKFVVLPPDPDAARRVRVASNPGYYNVRDSLKFSVTRRSLGARIINEASFIYFQQGKENAITKVELPDGYNIWAAAQEPGTTVLWIKQKDLVRRYDFADPANIKETRHDGPVPDRILEAMQSILAAPDESSAPKDNPPPAATPEKKTAGRTRNVDWSKPPPDSFFEGRYEPELLARLSRKPEKLNEDNNVWPLAEQILRAAVEGDPQFRHLLTDEKLKAADNDSRILTMSLAAYDYSVFGNKAALKVILERLESGQNEDYLTAFYLGFVDEWDQSIPAVERVFAHRDGGKGDEYHGFWAHRQWFFPESYAAFQKKQLESNKLDAASLQGVWKGSKEGVDVTLRFGKSQDWEVRFLETDRKSALSTDPSYTATRLHLKAANEKGTPVHCGTLRRGSDGELLLQVLEHGGKRGDLGYRRVSGLVLEKNTEQPKGADAEPGEAAKPGKLLEAAEILRIAQSQDRLDEDTARIRTAILTAAADKNPDLKPLLKDEKLKQADDELQSIRLALAAYDYSLNGNKEALQFILDKVATVTEDVSDEVALDTLAWIDEWELSTAAYDKHSGRIYGAQVDAYGMFWEQRESLFPEKYAKHFAKEQQAAKMDAASLRGVWKGSKDGISVELRLGDKSEWSIRKGDQTISKAVIRTRTPPGGSMVELSIQEISKGMAGYSYSWLKRDSTGSLYLHLYREAAQQRPSVVEVELTRQADAPELPAAPEKKTADTAPKPQHEYAQSLFKSWQANARSDGKIPGALIGLLAGKVDEFIKSYTGAGQDAVKLTALRPKLDATRDWTPAEAVALLDEIATINIAPLGWAEMPMKFDGFRHIKAGQPLPKELESADWGATAENGLRAAWLLEPRAEQYVHGTVLKARVLFHNSGKEPVVFQTETWHQYDGHKALDAKGAEISVKGSRFSGITPMATFRLAPGEYCEVTGHGLAIGAGEYKDEFGTGSVGAIIEAKEGDTVTLSHTVDASYGGWTRPDDPKDPAELRKKQIAERIAREAPLPYAAADRELLLRRVALDLTGVAPTPEEIAAFTADKSPDALANLTTRLQNQPAVKPWSGQLPTSETKFRVLPADPDAAKKPRTANAPGRYVLDDNVHLLVRQVTEVGTRMNSAQIVFTSPGFKGEPHDIALPASGEGGWHYRLADGTTGTPGNDGKFTAADGTEVAVTPQNPITARIATLVDRGPGFGLVSPAGFAFAWVRGSGELWLVTKGVVRSYDFTNPSQVKETRIEPGGINNIPQHLHEPLKDARALLGDSAPAGEKPKTGAATPAELQERYYAARKKRGEPMPVGIGARAVIIRSLTLDITGELPTQEERNAFEADNAPDALGKVIARLQAKAGKLPPGLLDSEPDAPKGAAAKLTPDALLGAWRGTVNGEKLMLSFHRPPAEKDVQCDIYFGEGTIGVPASFAIAEDGGSAEVVQHTAGGGMKFGTIIPGEPGKLKLELYGRQQGQQETMLTRDAEPPVSNERKSSAQPKSGAKLDRAKLEGTWEGEKDGATVKVEFQWLSEHQQVRWEVKRPGSSIAAEMSVVMAPDGNSADFIFRKGLDFEATQGRVTPGEGGTLHLEIIPNPNVSDPGYPAVKGLVLKRNPDGTVPKTSEAGAVR